MTRPKLRVFLLTMSMLAAAILAAAPAPAQTPAPSPSPSPRASPVTTSAPALTTAEAGRALEVLQDPAKRAQVIETLKAIGAASPSPIVATPAPVASAVERLALPPNSLGAQLVELAASWAEGFSQDIVATAQAATDAPSLWRLMASIASDSSARVRAFDAVWRLSLVIISALLVEALVARALRRPLAALSAEHAASAEAFKEPEPDLPLDAGATAAAPDNWRLAQRLPLALLAWVLSLLPIAAFAGAGALVLATPIGASELLRLLAVEALKAYVVCRAVLSVSMLLVADGSPRLRLLHVSDDTAAYIQGWARRFTIVGVLGGTLTESAQMLGASERLHYGLVKIVAFVLIVFWLTVVLQCRKPVARWIRADEGAREPFASLRNRFADTWHVFAILVIVAFWGVWTARLRAGLSGSLQLTVVSAGVVTVSRLCAIVALGVLDRTFRVQSGFSDEFPILAKPARRYYPLLRITLLTVLTWVTLLALLEVWGVEALDWFRNGAIGGRLISALITVGLAVTGAVVVWEGVNAALERRLKLLSRGVNDGRAARLRTVMPILRTTLMIVILTVVGVTVLSEIGVNVAPLLAGAGIVGIAIGFGAQKLVQDVITGLFLLLENAIQVGDWVTVSGLSGSVEKLSIRTIQLRAGDGALHIVPFSSVTSVTNANRGIGNAAVGVSVDYAEDTDRVGDVLKQIAVEMRQEPEFKTAMLSELQLWGVDRVDGASATISGQIVCTDAGRWSVQREFNRRMKQRFQQLGIVIAAPNRSFFIREPSPSAADGAPDAPPREEALAPAPARARHGRR
jgi:moderate conductance mechanosensitive channel